MRKLGLACVLGLLVSNVPGADNGAGVFTTTGNRQKLESGAATLLVAPASSGQASADHVTLRRGALQFTATAGYRVQALSLQVLAASKASGTVQVTDNGLIKVVARAGVLRVEDAAGSVVASLLPGDTFSSSAPQSADIRRRGCGGRDFHAADSIEDDRGCPPVSPSRPRGH